MRVTQSLKARMLALIGGSLLAILLIALGCFQLLSNNVRDYRQLIDGPLRAAQLIDEANLQFKSQVQEWKNVLLRGKDPVERDKYWGQFEARYRQVQGILEQLATQPGLLPEVSQQITQLRSAHQALQADYGRGRDAYIAAGGDASAGDKAVKGVDRAVTDSMSTLVEQIRQAATTQSATISASAAQTVWAGLLVLLVSGLVIGLFSLWMVSRQLVQPITRLIAYVADLSQGRFQERVASDRQDELGHLAVAANTLRDFLADTFGRLKSNAAQLDGASSELHQIARQMAEGTQEQFTRTDQVATAMTEMSATAQEVARHAIDAARAADDADASARQGEEVMRATVQSIHQMSTAIETTAGVIRQLETDSGRVGKVLEPAGAQRRHRGGPRRRGRARFRGRRRRSAQPGPAYGGVDQRDQPDHRCGATGRRGGQQVHRARPVAKPGRGGPGGPQWRHAATHQRGGRDHPRNEPADRHGRRGADLGLRRHFAQPD
jgi:methyl-accepting chemotaxis protein